MSIWTDLNAVLANSPELPGAACVGVSHLFDPRDDHEPVAVVKQRQNLAVEICTDCPALDACRTWSRTLNNRQLRGVVAGHIRRDPPKSTTTDLEVA